MSYKKWKLSCHLWHCYIWYQASDDWHLSLSICDSLSVTCYLWLDIWIFLSETCYYSQKIVPFSHCCMSRNFFLICTKATVFMLYDILLFHFNSKHPWTSLAVVGTFRQKDPCFSKKKSINDDSFKLELPNLTWQPSQSKGGNNHFLMFLNVFHIL